MVDTYEIHDHGANDYYLFEAIALGMRYGLYDNSAFHKASYAEHYEDVTESVASDGSDPSVEYDTGYEPTGSIFKCRTVFTATATTEVDNAFLDSDQDEHWVEATFDPVVSLAGGDTLTITWQVTFSE